MFINLILLLCSCTDYALKQTIQTEPELVVYPSAIDFGHVDVSSETGFKTFAVINAGDRELSFDRPVLPEGRFSLDDDLLETYTVQPGDVVDFNVYYAPITHEVNESEITLTTNDSDEDLVQISVAGVGDAPVIQTSADTIDFGEVSIGCEMLEVITITNVGNMALTISNIAQMVTQPQEITVTYGTNFIIPAELIPGESTDLLIDYVPNDILDDNSELTIYSNDPLTPEKVLSQTGVGKDEQWFSESWVQDSSDPLDIIFVVDNSGSMHPFQNELQNQMSTFLNIFLLTGIDYHLGFITTDSHYLITENGYSWIDSSYHDPVYWSESLISGIGVAGSGQEKGVEMVRHLLFNMSNDPLSTFIREAATLVIVYISDEKDYSTNGWSSYLNFFDNIKSDVTKHRQFAVIGDHPAGCTIFSLYNRNIEFGAGYYELTQRYNGSWYSICASDWGLQMQDLARDVSLKSEFELDKENVNVDSITVYVNGHSVPETDWSYDSYRNTVLFDVSHVPETGKTIQIDYSVLGCGQ